MNLLPLIELLQESAKQHGVQLVAYREEHCRSIEDRKTITTRINSVRDLGEVLGIAKRKLIFEPPAGIAQALIEQLTAERDALVAWKESALAVEQEWDAQALAMLLGGASALGKSCRKVIAEGIPRLIAERDAAQARAVVLCTALEMQRPRGDYESDAEMEACVAARAAALAGPTDPNQASPSQA